MTAINHTLKISDKERELFDFLLSVVREKTPETVLRVAGGWVRDKLLGLESPDIDIALNDLTGQQFAKLVIEKLGVNKEIHIISARPEQSKHLETAEIKIFDHIIDFVNLRKETYADNSRIPIIEFGTPEEDAARRDLTFNALFYNINENKLEDFTGKGLDDLFNLICRTPIDPFQTFIDDPLRVLRAVRFAARFDGSLEDDLIAAARTREVQEAFQQKISKERIWAELFGQGEKVGALNGPNPVYALSLINEIGFRDILFRPQNNNDNILPWDTDQNSPYHDLNIWDHTFASFKHLHFEYNWLWNEFCCFSAEELTVRNLSMILHDIGKCCEKYRQLKENGYHTYIEHEIGSGDLSEQVLDQLNAPIHIKERVVKLVREHMRLHHLPDDATDKSLRRFIRDLGSDWEHSVDIAISDAYGKEKAKWDTSIKDRYENFRIRIKELLAQQNNVVKPKRPINGYDLIDLGIKPGPKMGELLAALDDKLLENPNMEKSEALDFIKLLLSEANFLT